MAPDELPREVALVVEHILQQHHQRSHGAAAPVEADPLDSLLGYNPVHNINVLLPDGKSRPLVE